MKRQAVLFVIGFISSFLLMLVPWELFRFGLGVFLFLILPGLIWDSFYWGENHLLTERIVIALGLSLVNSLVVILILTNLPGQIGLIKLIIGLLISLSVPIILKAIFPLSGRQPGDKPAPARSKLKRAEWFILLLILLLTVGTRLINLSYSEFQGDEADVVVKAARVLTGDTAVLFEHKKGPAEILLVMAGWGGTGITNEWMARLPFALANIIGVVVVFLIGQRLGHPVIGGIAASLLAIEGYTVGFGRIVQYQSLVFSLSALAIFSLLLYQEHGHGRFLILAAVFYAGAAWAHYDAILALPTGLLLVGIRVRKERMRFKSALPIFVGAVLIGALLLGIFYIPYLRGSQFGSTVAYLSGRIGAGRIGFNHLPATFERTAVYNSIYYLWLIAFALGFQTLYTWRNWGRWGLFAAVIVLLAAITVLFWPERWQVQASSLAWVPFTVWLLGSLVAPGQSTLERAIWLWFGVPFIFYSFFVALPLTHIYTAVPGLILLAGKGLANLGQWVRSISQPIYRGFAVAGGVIYLLSTLYIFMIFVDHTPEYLRTFPDSKSPVYWTPYKEIPREGRFGFPYRAGWKAVGYLMDTGQISGSYDSNEEKEITDYYTRQAVRIDCARPDMFITAVYVQDEVPIRLDQLEKDFEPSTIISVGGQPKITIYQQIKAGGLDYSPVEPIEWQFDLGTTPERVAERTLRRGAYDLDDFIPIEVYIGEFAQLIGYRLNSEQAAPGSYIELTLLWRALISPPINYQVFTHLHDGTTMRGQLDGQPACGNAPTAEWQTGQIIVDPYRIPIKADAAKGNVPLTIGMYDLATLQRLPVMMADGSDNGDSVFLTEVVIRENEDVDDH